MKVRSQQPDDVRDLMARYCDGDARAFRELYALIAPPLLSYLLEMALESTLAEDILQQTFLKLHRARSTYVRGADPVVWIYAIADRTLLDQARRTHGRRAVHAQGPQR